MTRLALKLRLRSALIGALAALLLIDATGALAQPLESWNDGPVRARILKFIDAVTDKSSKDYVAPSERIAVFDNDGTLWAEQPVYFQLAFAFDRVAVLAPKHPQWKQQPFKGLLERDMKAVAATGEKGLLQIMAVTHSGMSTEAFAQTVADWIATARHVRFKRPYTELVYKPMQELLRHLRANGFKTFIVSGGGVEFMRVWTEKVYGIAPEQVIGSSFKTRFSIGADGKPVLTKLAEVEFVDDGPGKPAGINRFIGRRPIFAFGNSDGDHQMLQWTAAGSGARFAGLVHHTDAEREWAYDRNSHIGRLDKALDEANARGWTVVDMKRDWKQVFAFE